MGKVTISTHNGSTVHQAHNVRNEKVISKEKHIVPNGIHEIWKHESVRQAYRRLFDESMQRYNKSQTREERKITNYYNKIKNSEIQNPAYEMIIGIYGKDENGVQQCSDELGKQIMREFVDTWQERNPNLELIGAYYHADEQGEPHVHIDYIPVAHGYTRGMDTQAGLVKAFGEMGFEKHGRATAQIQWEQRENTVLDRLCSEHGLEVSHPKEEHIKHIDTHIYKAEKALKSTLEHTKGLLDTHDELRAEKAKLEAIRDKSETQAQKAIERKTKAFSRSWKRNKEKGWTYDRGLEKEIKTLVRERARDVETISKTDFDAQRQYDQAEQMNKQAEIELKNAREYKEQLENYIIGTAEKQAVQMFKDFIQREFAGRKRTSDERLREYCAEIKDENGISILDKFNQAEIELKQKYEQSWEFER